MIILRSITDSFNLVLGSTFTNAALALAYLAYWASNDFYAIQFKPDQEFWVKRADDSFTAEKILFATHIALAVLKWHDFFGVVNHFTTPLLTAALLLPVVWLINDRTFMNPLLEKDMDGDHISAMFMMGLELTFLLSVIVSCSIYSVIRILLGRKTTYPTVYASERSTDFILQNLGELEMFLTISSPAIMGYFLAALLSTYQWDDVNDRFGLVISISAVVTVQSLLPFIDRTENCAKWTKIASFVVLPTVVIALCVVNYAED